MGTVTYRNDNTGDIVELDSGDSRVGRLERLRNWKKLSSQEAAKDPAPVKQTEAPDDPPTDPAAPEPPAAGETPEPVDYSAKSVVELQKIADARNLTELIKGSGAKGKVVKADLVSALEAYDQGVGQRG